MRITHTIGSSRNPLRFFEYAFMGMGLPFALIGLGMLASQDGAGRTGEDWAGMLAFAGVGFGFIAIGYGMRRFRKGKLAQRDMLLRNGEKLRAKVTEISQDHSLSVNGRHPWRIYAQVKQGDAIYQFKSWALWYNPAEQMEREEVDVYVMPGNMKKYYMDTTFLKEVVEV